ncbi:hypothetical protein AALP_AA2G137300 [Arabis alpina]|uniref:RRM domain-containing protein n=1 Tax=Arabis alpina TaxID=50452 RepID=A0A087HH90_ARAAL|nr:hypothetical protein AALP_AA2G137300 [Arabis alpina]
MNIFKRSKPETALETEVDMKKQKQTSQDLNDIKETLTRLADRLEQIEAKVELVATKADLIESKVDLFVSKVDLLATKADLQAALISPAGKQVLDLNKAAKEEDETDSKNTPKKKTDGGSRSPWSSFHFGDAKNTTKKESDGGIGGSLPYYDFGDDTDTKNSPFSSNSDFGGDTYTEDSCFSPRLGFGGSGGRFSSSFGFNDVNSGGLFPFGLPANTDSKNSLFSSKFCEGDSGDDQTIIAKEFDYWLPEDDIKKALSKHFTSCGEITSVVVPTDPKTGATKGYAYIQIKEGVEKALKLNGSEMGGCNLVVERLYLYL